MVVHRYECSLTQPANTRECPPCAVPVHMGARPPGTPTLSLRPPSLTPQTRSVPTAQPGLDASPSGSAALCTHLYVEHVHHTLSVSILRASITELPLNTLPHETTRDWGPRWGHRAKRHKEAREQGRREEAGAFPEPRLPNCRPGEGVSEGGAITARGPRTRDPARIWGKGTGK